jgi:hypothetical protein
MSNIHLKTRVRLTIDNMDFLLSARDSEAHDQGQYHHAHHDSKAEDTPETDYFSERVANRIKEFQRRYSVQYGVRAAQVPLMKSIRESYNIDSSILVPRGTTTNAAIHVLRDKISAFKRQNSNIESENDELLEDMNDVIGENLELMDQVAVLQGYIHAVEGNVKTLEEERNYFVDELEVADRQIKRKDNENKALQHEVQEFTKLLQESGRLRTTVRQASFTIQNPKGGAFFLPPAGARNTLVLLLRIAMVKRINHHHRRHRHYHRRPSQR